MKDLGPMNKIILGMQIH